MLIRESRDEALARVGKALADGTRCRLLMAVVDGVAYPSHLAEHLGLSKTNVSNHLACLRDCGLVRVTHEGRRVRYTIADPHLMAALTELAQVVLAVTPSVECLNVRRPACTCDECAAAIPA